MQYCSYCIGPCFYHWSHPQLGIVFALAPSLHSFRSYFSTDLQEHIGHLLTSAVPLSVSYHLPFHTVHGVLKGRILKWFAVPFPVDHILSDLSTMIRPSWVAPQGMALFHWVRQGCSLVWLDWLVFCDYGFSVSALWCPLATPTVFLGFLLPAPAKRPYLGRGVFPHHRPSWPWMWNSSSTPCCTRAATAPWTWGCSSRLLPLTSDMG